MLPLTAPAEVPADSQHEPSDVGHLQRSSTSSHQITQPMRPSEVTPSQRRLQILSPQHLGASSKGLWEPLRVLCSFVMQRQEPGRESWLSQGHLSFNLCSLVLWLCLSWCELIVVHGHPWALLGPYGHCP